MGSAICRWFSLGLTWRRRGSGIRIGLSEALFELGYRLSGASKADGDALSLRQKRCHGPTADKANWIRTLMAVTIQDLIAVLAKRPNSYGKRIGGQLGSFNWLVFRHRRRSTVSSLKIDDRVSVQTAPPKALGPEPLDQDDQRIFSPSVLSRAQMCAYRSMLS